MEFIPSFCENMIIPEIHKLAGTCLLINDKRQKENEIQQISKLLDNEHLFRFAYVPFVIAKLVWDYADTILDIVSRLRIRETKALSRAIRTLHREYDQFRAPYVDEFHVQSEDENMMVFEDGVSDIMDQMILNLQCDLKMEYPDIDNEYMLLLIAVYQCDITLHALLLYAERQSESVAKKLDKHVGNILPRQMYTLKKLIIEFVGDMPPSEKFSRLREKYIKTFANQMALIELIRID